MASIHPTAVVAPGASLAAEVSIGPYCVVGPRVRLGNGTRLHAHVVIEGDTWLGAECEVFPFAVIGTLPQDKKLHHEELAGKLRIGDHNRIREHVTIHPGTSFGSGTTRVGDHNMLLVGCHIGHDAEVGNHVVFTNGAMAAGHTQIGDRAIVGAMAGIHQYARIGELAMVGAGAMVSHDAPPYSMVQGDRAQLVGVNVVGMHRNHFSAEQKAIVRRTFRLLFWRAGTVQQRLDALRATPLARDPFCQRILAFVASSQRGVCTPRGSRRSELAETAETAETSVDLDDPHVLRPHRAPGAGQTAET